MALLYRAKKMRQGAKHRSQLSSLLRKTATVWLFLCLFLSSAHAQFYNGSQLTFGKNRVQYQHFNWQYLRAEQYDVYYYPTGRALAQYVFYRTPEIVAEIEKLLNYTSKKKLQIIVYNTQSDFRESNFAYDYEDFYNQGGVTNIYGTKIYIYFDGNRAHLDRMIRGGIMNVYAHWMVQGATIGSNISADYLMNVPGWFYSGLASYFGESWNSTVESHVKNGILTNSYKHLDELSPVEATYAGHSFWKYIVDIYGEEIIPKVLYYTRSGKNIENGMSRATMTPFKALAVQWYKYYMVMFHPDMSKSMPAGEEILRKPNPKRDYARFCFSPEGDKYAYVTNEAGQVRVWLKTEKWKSPRCILKKYHKTEDNPDLSFPLIAWHPSGEILGLTYEHKGDCLYQPYDLEKRRWGKKFLVDVEKITSWCYSPDGQRMLFSGFKNGQSDIYLYSFAARSFQNITNDFYDDYNPVYMNPQQIAFASNRPVDSILLKDNFLDASNDRKYNLFQYNLKAKDSSLLRVTDSPYADEFDLQPAGNQLLLFLSDKDGVVNRYEAVFDSSISRIDTAVHYMYYAKTYPLTDRAYNIEEQAYNPATNTIADISLMDKYKHIWFTELHSLYHPEINPSSFHKKILERRIQQSEKQDIKDSVQNEDGQERHGFILSADQPSKAVEVDDFDSDTTYTSAKSGHSFPIPVGLPYRVQYSIDQLITQADFSFLNTSYQQFEGGRNPIYLNTGLNALFMLGINDLFEDYRITGGFRIGLNLNSYEFMFSYENLSRRLDRQITLYRQAISSEVRGIVYRQNSNSLFYTLKFPFTKTSSMRLTLKGRYETNVVTALSDQTLQAPNERHVWAGAKLEYIFDSSKELYTNLWRGTKLKLFAEYEQRIERETLNLFVIGFDARRSFKLYRNMTLALRFAGSTNTGSARLVYYLGGVDNWIGAKFNSSISVDPTKNYAYQTLATNMRGFQQNIRNGTSFLLFNGELRIPIVQLIVGHKLGWNLLNSLQINLFGDYGTAWTGFTPFSPDNCLYTRYIDSGPIHAEVKRQVDPFVGGFGIGARVSIFGYFLRFDYAWGVEDMKIANKKGMFMFSLGTDF
jgi:WD40 repeat protein